MKKLHIYLSDKDNHFIVNGLNKATLTLLYMLILLLLVMVCLYQSQHITLFYLVAIVYFIVIIGFITLNNTYRLILQYLLYEKVNLAKVEDLANTKYLMTKNQRAKREYAQANLIIKGLLAYLRGNYDQSLDLLNQVDTSHIIAIHRKNYTRMMNELFVLNNLELNNNDQANNYISKLPPKAKHRVMVIRDILAGKTTNTKLPQPSTHTNKLSTIEYNYYQGLLAYTQHDTEQANYYFQQISLENSELFYVKNAKSYLEEISYAKETKNKD